MFSNIKHILFLILASHTCTHTHTHMNTNNNYKATGREGLNDLLIGNNNTCC